MLVNVCEVSESSEGPRVRFECAEGKGTGTWHGETPQPGDRCYVEFEFMDPVVAMAPGETRDQVVDDVESVSLIGRLEEIDQYGVGTVRFGNSLLLVKIEGSGCWAGSMIRVRGKLDLYEYFL